MFVNSAPIWVTPPNTSLEIGATKSLVLNFTVRARPEATFTFSFQKADGSNDSNGSSVKINFFGSHKFTVLLH